MHFNDNTLLLFGQVEGVFHPLTSKILAAASFAACALLRRLAIAGCCRKKRRGGRRHIITAVSLRFATVDISLPNGGGLRLCSLFRLLGSYYYQQ